MADGLFKKEDLTALLGETLDSKEWNLDRLGYELCSGAGWSTELDVAVVKDRIGLLSDAMLKAYGLIGQVPIIKRELVTAARVRDGVTTWPIPSPWVCPKGCDLHHMTVEPHGPCLKGFCAACGSALTGGPGLWVPYPVGYVLEPTEQKPEDISLFEDEE